MKMNFLQGIFTAVSAAIAAYLNILLVPLIVLIVVMIIDYLSGMAQAYVVIHLIAVSVSLAS